MYKFLHTLGTAITAALIGPENVFSCTASCVGFLVGGGDDCMKCIDAYSPTRLPVSFGKDLAYFLKNGYVQAWCKKRDKDGEGVDLEKYPTGWKPLDNGSFTGCEVTTDYPGIGTVSIQSHDHVVELMKKFPAHWEAGKVFKGNELGYVFMTPVYYKGLSPPSILLGATPSQHKVCREFLVKWFGTCDADCEAKLLESAKKIMTAKKIDVKHVASKWVAEQLVAKAFPGEEDQFNYDDIVTLQDEFTEKAFPASFMPEGVAGLIAGGVAKKVLALREQVKPLVQKYHGADLEGKSCDPTPDCADQVASAFVDSILAAGGLSVPLSIHTGVYLMFGDTDKHGDTFPHNFVLDKKQIDQFYWESLRFFPPVVGFPYWSPFPEAASPKHYDHPYALDGTRWALNLALASKDPNAWGADAHKFRLRPLTEYQTKYVDFADFAHDDTVAKGLLNRDCPGKGLTLKMGKAFFTAFDQDEWQLAKGAEVPTYKDVTPFVSQILLEKK